MKMNYNRKKKTLTENINTYKGGMCQISAFATTYLTTKEEPRSHGEKERGKGRRPSEWSVTTYLSLMFSSVGGTVTLLW